MPMRENAFYGDPGIQRGIQNLGKLIFGDPANEMRNQYYAMSAMNAKAEAMKRLADMDRAAAADAAQGRIGGEIFNALFEKRDNLPGPNPDGSAGYSVTVPRQAADIRQNLGPLLTTVGNAYGNPDAFGKIIQSALALSGNNDLMRMGLTAAGHMPTEKFAGTDERANYLIDTENRAHAERNKYSSDRSLEGTKYTADSNYRLGINRERMQQEGLNNTVDRQKGMWVRDNKDAIPALLFGPVNTPADGMSSFHPNDPRAQANGGIRQDGNPRSVGSGGGSGKRIILTPGAKAVDENGNEIANNPVAGAPEKTIIVRPGDTLVKEGKPIFTAPQARKPVDPNKIIKAEKEMPGIVDTVSGGTYDKEGKLTSGINLPPDVRGVVAARALQIMRERGDEITAFEAAQAALNEIAEVREQPRFAEGFRPSETPRSWVLKKPSNTPGAPGVGNSVFGGQQPAAAPAPANASQPNLPSPKSKSEYDALPNGAQYIAPNGSVRIKGSGA